MGGDSSFDLEYGYQPAPMLGPREIREMAAAGIEFGSHSRRHPNSLTRLSDHALRDEVEGSRRMLESLLQHPVDSFSYPHSGLDARVETAVVAAGYRVACAGVGSRFDRFCIGRIAPPLAGGLSLAAAVRWRGLKGALRTGLLRPPLP